MKIGIMGAMPEEISLLEKDMIGIRKDEHGGRIYNVGKLYGIDTVLAFSRWGKVASAITASTLISKYEIDFLIFTGVAGALAKHIQIGDFVVGDELYQHDMDARPLFKKHEIPLTDRTFFESNKQLTSFLKNSGDYFSSEIKKTFSLDTLRAFSITYPRLYVGKIASGDAFVSEESKINVLLTDMPDVLAVEMEGGAVAQVCHDYKVPFVVIRTISDKADGNAQIDFKNFLTNVAKHYSNIMVKHLYLEYFASYAKNISG